MHKLQSIVTNELSVFLTRSLTRLRCAKTAERIKMLFVVNTLHRNPDTPTEGEGELGIILPIVDPLHSQEW